MLFNKTRTKQAYTLLATDIDSGKTEVVGYITQKSLGIILCSSANTYEETTRLHYEVVESVQNIEVKR